MREERIVDYYNAISQSYDELYGEEQLRKYVATNRIVKKLEGRILDMGCGTLLFEEYVFSTHLWETISHIVGLDISEGMISSAKKKAASNQRTGFFLDLVLGDAKRLPFRDKAYDYTVSFTFLSDDMSSYKDILSEAERVTRKGILYTIMRSSSLSVDKRLCRRYTGMIGREQICFRMLQENVDG